MTSVCILSRRTRPSQQHTRERKRSRMRCVCRVQCQAGRLAGYGLLVNSALEAWWKEFSSTLVLTLVVWRGRAVLSAVQSNRPHALPRIALQALVLRKGGMCSVGVQVGTDGLDAYGGLKEMNWWCGATYCVLRATVRAMERPFAGSLCVRFRAMLALRAVESCRELSNTMRCRVASLLEVVENGTSVAFGMASGAKLVR